MRSRLSSILSFLCVSAAIVLLATHPAEVSAAACEGVRQSLTQVFPALFPFFVLTKLLLSRGGTGNAPKLPARLCEKLLAVPAASFPVFLLSLVSGCPVGATAAAEVYRRGGCTRDEAERLTVFCSNCGPAFLLGVVSPRLPGGAKDALFLLGAQVLIALWLGVVMGAGKRPSCASAHRDGAEKTSFVRAFTEAVLSGGRNALTVCAYVVFFTAISGFLPETPLLRGLGELTGGVLLLQPELPFALPTAAFLLGFGGLSVGCQVLAAISETDMSGKRYFPARLLHGGLMFCAALLYERRPPLLAVLSLLMLFFAICVKRGRKQRGNAVYCSER